MTDTLREVDGRQQLRLERQLAHPVDRVWRAITDAQHFGQWYPLQPRDFDLAVGNRISLVDEEGTTYNGVVVEFDPPRTFCFREEDDVLRLELIPEEAGCRLILTHIFDDREMAVRSAAGWDNCLEALRQIVAGEPIVWRTESEPVRRAYAETFGMAHVD